MKKCKMCGAELEDQHQFCHSCGSRWEAAESIHDGDSLSNTASEDTIICKNCGKPTVTYSSICSHCGKPNGGSKTVITPKQTYSSTKSYSSSRYREINSLCLILIIFCAIIWAAVPFAAINRLTFGDQPTALQLLMDDVLYIGELTESATFWAAIISLIGIVICFCCTLMAANGVTRAVAVLTELPLLWTMYEACQWAYDAEEFFEILGIGYWGILLLLGIVAISSKSDA